VPIRNAELCELLGDSDDAPPALPKPPEMPLCGDDDRKASGTIGLRSFHEDAKGTKRSPMRLLDLPQRDRPGRLLQLGGQPRPLS
jgi:hypothetical protein